MLDEVRAPDVEDHRRQLRARGLQMRAARRRSGLPRLEPAFARSGCRSHTRRAGEAPSPQVRSGDYDDAVGGGVWLFGLANGTKEPISEGREYIRALNDRLRRNPTASGGDRAAAENVTPDLENALVGR